MNFIIDFFSDLLDLRQRQEQTAEPVVMESTREHENFSYVIIFLFASILLFLIYDLQL